jgi:hypothetical protein
MFKSIDVLIGLAVIMLALSMAVTVITQFVIAVINTRGAHLKRGLTDLLTQLDPALEERIAGAVATAILTQPLVCSTLHRLGSVVHREEFTKLLLDLARDPSALEPTAKAALKKALENNGIANPDAVLKNIRKVTLQIEATYPHLASDVRQTLAILREAPCDLVAKVHSWFDQTMDRVSQRFTATTRAITFAGALLVAFALQVDTVGLVNRLAADDALRQAFVQQATGMQPPATGAATTATIDRQYLQFLAQNGLIVIAPNPSQWMERWAGVNVFGVLVTALLLSLGAPFWYNALSKLLQLRSALAVKDDTQRAARQATGDLEIIEKTDTVVATRPPTTG